MRPESRIGAEEADPQTDSAEVPGLPTVIPTQGSVSVLLLGRHFS